MAKVQDLTVINNLLILSGDMGLIAIDKFSGTQTWDLDNKATYGEEFVTSPVEFNNIIYARAIPSGTLYAISISDGKIIGYVRIDDTDFFGGTGYDSPQTLENGILFNIKNAVVIYEAK